jgi:hypothetical protein
MRCVGFSGMLLSFVTTLQDDTKDSNNMWCDVLMQSTESPIFDASFGSENGVSCSHERHKIGDSVLCVDVLGFLGCYVLLLQLCKMITKDSNNMWCDVLVFWDATPSFVTTLQDDNQCGEQKSRTFSPRWTNVDNTRCKCNYVGSKMHK